MSNPDNWRTKHYPTQTCVGHEHCYNDDSTLSSPIPEDPPLKLPTVLHATRDANNPPKGRTIVICLDGTGDKFDNDNSNVVNFVACLKKDDPYQVTYYQSGIGTYDGEGLKNGISAGVDMAIGSGLGIHIKDAYRFLMENYCEGDRICLLGFSRGSYTVRCLAGMLHKVGLLPAHNGAQVQFAYKFYKDDSKLGWEMSAGFKKTFCTNVSVYFVGVWDCVASVGFIPRKLPFSKSPTSTIHYFRHAMALDEHRAKFKLCHWEHNDPAAKSREVEFSSKEKMRAEAEVQNIRIRKALKSCFGSHDEEEIEGSEDGSTRSKRRLKILSRRKEDQKKHEEAFEKEDHGTHEHIETDVLEVWFAGAHADVGGGAVENNKRHMLSRIPLRWMLRQCFSCDTGILFSTAALAEAGIDINTVYPVYKEPKQPIVGPSPSQVEWYEEKTLSPLRRRSTALGVDPRIKKNDDHHHGEHKYEADSYTLFDPHQEEKHHIILDRDLLPEQVEDHFDALAPINDQLEQAKGWWILEWFWPVKVRIQKKESEIWEKVVRLNNGRYRVVRELEPRLHWTVRTRMAEKGYKIVNPADCNACWGVVA